MNQLKEEDKIRGRIIKKSIELYMSKKPIIFSYDKKGRVHRKYYKINDFARDFGVSCAAIYKWSKTGKMNKFMKIRLLRLKIIPMKIW